MEIQIDPHTLERAEERGTDEEEIKDVINSGTPIPAKHVVWEKLKSMISNRNGTISFTSKREWR